MLNPILIVIFAVLLCGCGVGFLPIKTVYRLLLSGVGVLTGFLLLSFAGPHNGEILRATGWFAAGAGMVGFLALSLQVWLHRKTNRHIERIPKSNPPEPSNFN